MRKKKKTKKYYNMDIQRINQHTSAFNEITHYIESDNGKEKIEVWFARELQSVLGYVRWENFTIAIGRAVESCKSQNINVDDHFREVTKMISLAKGAKREVKDYMLTRFACYLIAQNGDPKKDTTEDMKLRLGIKSTGVTSGNTRSVACFRKTIVSQYL